MCSPDKLGIQLLFIPEEFGGFGGGAFDVYCVCEEMARIDLGVATAVLATFLGSDPITVGATPEQKKLWLSRIARRGSAVRLRRHRARCRQRSGRPADHGGPRDRRRPRSWATSINGSKQWISNGGIADAYTVLANTPAGPSWFIVEKGARASRTASPKTSTASALSNTAALSLSDVYVDADRLVGGVEGQGLLQAQAVFGYTRLMVAAFGLGAGWAALDRAIPYSAKRIQAGAPLSEKQGYTHKLIVPNVARLEAGRAYIEETAERIDAGEGSLNTEGAIAKYMSTEAGNAAADASIQALGGYGYTHEYMVEKISRDVRITTIYEGTSEIMEMTISRDRWQFHLKTRGQHYHDQAREFEALHARAPHGRRRLRGAGLACAGRSHGAGAGRPADPLPAHSPAPGRMDRVRGVRRQPGAPRGAHGGRAAEREGQPALRRGGAGRDRADLRARGGAQGGPGRFALDRRAPARRPMATMAASKRR